MLKSSGGTRATGETNDSRFRQPFDFARETLTRLRVREFLRELLQFNYGQYGLGPGYVEALLQGIETFEGSTREELVAHLAKRGIDFQVEPFKAAYQCYKWGGGKDAASVDIIREHLQENGVFIDVGGGDSMFANMVAKAFPGLASVILYETGEYKWTSGQGKPDSKVTRLQGEPVISNGRLIGYQIPVRDGNVSTVFMRTVLHHIPPEGLELFFSEIARILKPAGRLIILEDSFPEDGIESTIPFTHPLMNRELTQAFLRLPPEDRKAVLTYLDVHGNVIVRGEKDFDFPFGFRSIDEWGQIIRKSGFEAVSFSYTGFMAKHFHQPGYGVLVFDRTPTAELRT